MTYDEAMISVSSGGLVEINDKVIYMSVDFNRDMAGKIVYSESGKEIEYIPTDEEKASTDWVTVILD